MLFIFDIGGVCTTNAPLFKLISNELKITEEEFAFYCGISSGKAPSFLQNKDISFSTNIFLKLTKGLITTKQFWNEFSERSTCEIKQDYWETFFTPIRNQKVYEIIEKLKFKNKVVAGTNTIQTHYDIHMQHHDYDIFHKIYASQKIHEAKPELNFWKFILSSESISPLDTYFIDDTKENILAATSLGINAHLFTTAENLENSIKTYL